MQKLQTDKMDEYGVYTNTNGRRYIIGGYNQKLYESELSTTLESEWDGVSE